MASRAALLALSCFLAAPSVKAWPSGVAGIEKATIQQAFSDVHSEKQKKEMRVGNWMLYPQGFGFFVPEGMVTGRPSRGNAATLVSDSPKRPVRANIVLTVTGEDRQLLKKTARDFEGAARMSGFDRFELLSFERDTYLGEECLRYSFLMGGAPRMFSQVRMFNRDGKCYIQTLSVEFDLIQMRTALRQFGAFCDSFFFL